MHALAQQREGADNRGEVGFSAMTFTICFKITDACLIFIEFFFVKSNVLAVYNNTA